jgi:hypothetical protein
LLIAILVIAAGTTTAWAAGSAGTRAIKKVTHTNAQRVLISADSAWENPDVCGRSNQVVLVAGRLSSEAVYREMLAMILSAHVAGRSVNLRVDGCIDVDGEGYPVVKEVTVR